jgi:hypothetical protein
VQKPASLVWVDAVEKGLDPSVVPLDADWAENSLSF